MNILVVGYGNAGQRHAEILSKKLGHCVEVVEAVTEKRSLANMHGYRALLPPSSVCSENQYDGIVIAVAPFQHAEIAKKWAPCTSKLFIEKPGIGHGSQLIKYRELEYANPHQIAVGYQLRAVQRLISMQRQCRESGQMLIVHDLQNMHLWPSASYSRDILLEYSHEIDLANWFMGPFSAVRARWVSASSLNILCKTSERVAQITIDSNFDGYRRGCILHASDSPMGYQWDFSREDNDAAYSAQLGAWLAGKPYCTIDHANDTARLLSAIERSLVSNEWTLMA